MKRNRTDKKGKEGAALIMVMLSGMLIIIIGIGMLFFYQKQVERRMKLEFGIHRRLAAKSGFNIVQYNSGTTGTYHYVTADNRPDIWVTVGEAEPIYVESYSPTNFNDRWEFFSETSMSTGRVVNPGGSPRFAYELTDANSISINRRVEFVFKGSENFCWNAEQYPFGLCYEAKFETNPQGPAFPWIGYMYIGESNLVSDMLTSNRTASFSVSGIYNKDSEHRLHLHEHETDTLGSVTNGLLMEEHIDTAWFVPTELYLDGTQIAVGTKDPSALAMQYFSRELPSDYNDITNVVFGMGGISTASDTNYVLRIAEFKVRNPYEYEIHLTWTNKNRYFGTTNVGDTTNVLATVIDSPPKVLLGKQYYFFDSFETVVE